MKSIQRVHEQTRHAYNLAAQVYHDLFHDELDQKEYDRRLLDGFAARFAKGALLWDAGCEPCAHIGRYLAGKGLQVVGVDISDRCVELARIHNPGMPIVRADLRDRQERMSSAQSSARSVIAGSAPVGP